MCIRRCPVNKGLDHETLEGEELTGRIFRIKSGKADPVGLCVHCDPAPCIEACPASAIKRNKGNIVIVDAWECNVCGICSEVCPRNAIFMEYRGRKWAAVKCDLCRGKPVCVKSCLTNALEVIW